MTEDQAQIEALKRNRHKSKFMTHKTWRAVHDSVKGWHVALVDSFHLQHAQAVSKAREAFLNNDAEGFEQAAHEARMAVLGAAFEAKP